MSIPHLVHVLFVRQRRVFVAVFLAVVAATAAVTFSLPKQYKATATLFVGENRPISTGANAVQLDEVLSQTYAKLLDTHQVAEAVVRALPFSTTVKSLYGKLDFTVVNGTRLIEINAVDRDPRRARQLANTYADVFVRDQQHSASNASLARQEELNRRIGTLVVEIDKLRDATSPADISRLAQMRNQLSAARSSYAAAEQNIALQGSNVALSSRASAPDSPDRPRPRLYIALGVIFGLILASAAALVRDVFDKRLRSEEELVELVGAPVLASIPGRRVSSRERQVSEAFQLLRTNIQLQDPLGERPMLAVTSAQPGDGKTTVTSRLATALAATGVEVTAVDCDLRKPDLGPVLGVDGSTGVTSVLTGSRLLNEAIAYPPDSSVRVLASGPCPPDPAVLLSLRGFRDLLVTLRAESDYVLVDTPPVAAGADASTIAASADGVLLVVDLGAARRDLLAATRSQLEKSGTPVLGIVLNRVSESRAFGGYYYASDPDEQLAPDAAGGESGRVKS
jgi:capsular exopolysaccharide synthesis family protein